MLSRMLITQRLCDNNSLTVEALLRGLDRVLDSMVLCEGLPQRAGPGTQPCYTGAVGRPGCSPSCTAPEEAQERVRRLWPGHLSWRNV